MESIVVGLRDRSGSNRNAASQDAFLLQLILEASPDLIYLYDRKQERYLFVSNRSTAVLGYSPRELQELRGEGIRGLIHPEDLARVQEHYGRQETLRDHEVSMSTYRVAHAHGGYRLLRCRQKVFSRARDGTVNCILGVATDITHEANTQQELMGLRAEILRIRDEERRRIALEMHDTVVQHLVGASLLLKSIEDTVVGRTGARETLGEAQASLSRALRDMLAPLTP